MENDDIGRNQSYWDAVLPLLSLPPIADMDAITVIAVVTIAAATIFLMLPLLSLPLLPLLLPQLLP